MCILYRLKTKNSVVTPVLNLSNWNQGRPALGMFEVFGRTGPPILGGRLFGR